MSKRDLKAPLIDASEAPRCEDCGTMLDMGTNTNGIAIEWCPKGCFRTRVVPRRRPSCPECGHVPWDSNDGCQDCGYGWTTRACKWDGTVVYWRPPSATIGYDVDAAAEADEDLVKAESEE